MQAINVHRCMVIKAQTRLNVILCNAISSLWILIKGKVGRLKSIMKKPMDFGWLSNNEAIVVFNRMFQNMNGYRGGNNTSKSCPSICH